MKPPFMVEYCDTLHIEREEKQGIQSTPKEGDHIMSTRQMQRREFLGTAVAGTAGALIAGKTTMAAAADLDPCAIVPLGKTLKA